MKSCPWTALLSVSVLLASTVVATADDWKNPSGIVSNPSTNPVGTVSNPFATPVEDASNPSANAAGDASNPSANPQGTQDKKGKNAKPAADATDQSATSNMWTQADIAANCLSIADGNAKGNTYKSCLERQKRHLGHVKSDTDMEQLNDAKAKASVQ